MLFVSGSDCGQPAYTRPTDCVLCPVVSVDSPLISDLLIALFVSGNDSGQTAYIRPTDCVVCVR